MKTMLNLILVLILSFSVGNLSAAPTKGSEHSEETERALKTLKKSAHAFENAMETPNNEEVNELIDTVSRYGK